LKNNALANKTGEKKKSRWSRTKTVQGKVVIAAREKLTAVGKGTDSTPVSEGQKDF